MTVGQRIAHLRERRGLSQSSLAKDLNVGQSTLAMWETDKRGLKDEVIVQIAEYFNVSTDYLLG
ncbi:helix-turn-helix domain-containing protein, partial [Jeotgalibaca porci]|uniref:helix-turn-helix domain-containing protein n=1 Tax=Jeotgalibaca porci TaxID=1868793 RepID=UPI0035A16FCB